MNYPLLVIVALAVFVGGFLYARVQNEGYSYYDTSDMMSDVTPEQCAASEGSYRNGQCFVVATTTNEAPKESTYDCLKRLHAGKEGGSCPFGDTQIVVPPEL